jgi:hypothetical protein
MPEMEDHLKGEVTVKACVPERRHYRFPIYRAADIVACGGRIKGRVVIVVYGVVVVDVGAHNAAAELADPFGMVFVAEVGMTEIPYAANAFAVQPVDQLNLILD